MDATYQYTDFGETTIQGDDQADNEVCYTGGIYDQTTGLYYLNARYYDPEDGRFLTEDTYRGDTAKPETGHLYVYCANNPVNYVDPSGHIAVKVANAIAGAAISVLIDISLKAFLHYIAKKGSLRGFKNTYKRSCLLDNIWNDRWCFNFIEIKKKNANGCGWSEISYDILYKQ